MLSCLNPVILNSGLVVGCGKCLNCLSKRREEWSIRLQLHADSYEEMPFFLTLTYRPDALVFGDTSPTLVKSHFRLFIKRFRDRYKLYNTRFTFFGCGEYGDRFSRPHGHLLFFGVPQLKEEYDRDVFALNEKLSEIWSFGHVKCVPAYWSGIHYVTKYTLKIKDDDFEGIEKPFTIVSQNIGKYWFQTDQAYRIKDSINTLMMNRAVFHEIMNLDTFDYDSFVVSAKVFLQRIKPYFNIFRVLLPSGKEAYLPYYFRSKLIGRFEDWKDNPFAIYNYVQRLCDSFDYIKENYNYDVEHVNSMAFEQALDKFDRVRQRLILNNQKKLSKAIFV